MAESSMEDFLRVIKRFGAFFTFKIFNLIRSRDLQSFGAIAGLALAILFTWKLIRRPRQPQRQSKRHTPSTSSSGVSSPVSAIGASLEASNPAEECRLQNVNDDEFPAMLTLSQIVRQRLREGRKVTCCLLGVILEETSSEELQKQATVRSSVLDVLLEITRFTDVYLMERVLDDESEKKVLAALEAAGFFRSGGLVRDKVLFCSTENGRASFVRQLEPDWHIDSKPEIITQLSLWITKPERLLIYVILLGYYNPGLTKQLDLVRKCFRKDSSSINFTSRLPGSNDIPPMSSAPHHWNSSSVQSELLTIRLAAFKQMKFLESKVTDTSAPLKQI